MDNLLDLTLGAPLSLTTLVVNMLLGILLAGLLAWFYTDTDRRCPIALDLRRRCLYWRWRPC